MWECCPGPTDRGRGGPPVRRTGGLRAAAPGRSLSRPSGPADHRDRDPAGPSGGSPHRRTRSGGTRSRCVGGPACRGRRPGGPARPDGSYGSHGRRGACRGTGGPPYRRAVGSGATGGRTAARTLARRGAGAGGAEPRGEEFVRGHVPERVSGSEPGQPPSAATGRTCREPPRPPRTPPTTCPFPRTPPRAPPHPRGRKPWPDFMPPQCGRHAFAGSGPAPAAAGGPLPHDAPPEAVPCRVGARGSGFGRGGVGRAPPRLVGRAGSPAAQGRTPPAGRPAGEPASSGDYPAPEETE